MANYCYFTMMITGVKEAVDELISMMKWEGIYAENGLGRIYEIDEYDRDFHPANNVSAKLTGDCAWSVTCAMRSDNGRREVCLESETKRLGLVVEVFSEELGCAFQEHILIDKGEVIIDDCVDYEAHYVGEHDTIEAYNEEYDTNFTEDMVDDDYVYEGGFEHYGDFKDHLPFLNIRTLLVDDLLVAQ